MKLTAKILLCLALCWLTANANAFTVFDITNRVKELDTNKDGGVSMAEAEAGNASRIKEHFEKLDANKDGKVTVEEIKALSQ
jgi:Ca2+-binding EF-hand superfamily protein